MKHDAGVSSCKGTGASTEFKEIVEEVGKGATTNIAILFVEESHFSNQP